MNLIGLEEISEYQNHYKFKLFLFDDEIRLDDTKKYVATIEVYDLMIKEELKGKGLCERKGCVDILDLNEMYSRDSKELSEAIKRFVCEEVYYLSVESENIRLI